MDLKSMIVDVPDFPKKGVIFKDLTPVIQDRQAFNQVIDDLAAIAGKYSPDRIAAIESRGFIFGAALARDLKLGFSLIRKKGKLPRKTITILAPNEYAVEYFEAHVDSIGQGENVIIVDDLIATGSSGISAIEIVEQLGGKVVAFESVVELTSLQGVSRMEAAHPEVPIYNLIKC
ncbi:MAG TPA: adenine phosphoribosyltransferase [Candidatus Saccharicenans sp.]|jgi:adenine phosphoribosyltransferase|nr:adenine phosphoribosyltransferase [Candidatus Saccharicenans sp.]HRD02702.1 adenine phosphoribosyltransferase [Candidatus Saccharicenans sp.]